jgi:hypothetical protein
MIPRRTLPNGATGAVVGSVPGYLPLVPLVAPVVGGGVAGSLERDGPRRGAVAGGVAGLLTAALATVTTGTITFVRLGDLPLSSPDLPVEGLALAAAPSLLASLGRIVVAGLGGILEADRRRAGAREPLAGDGRSRPWLRVLGSPAAGAVTFGAVAVVLTVVLDPLIRPSLLVGLPAGIIAGTGVAVLASHHLRGLDRQRVPRVVPDRTPRSAVGVGPHGRRARGRERRLPGLTIRR